MSFMGLPTGLQLGIFSLLASFQVPGGAMQAAAEENTSVTEYTRRFAQLCISGTAIPGMTGDSLGGLKPASQKKKSHA